ncbi:hypothetical protein TIFTF001_020658 [Ficus carica]|uniref:Phytocyanin domain-containing protein n=1 Tax=Ficus carica TaxID=3494 RepID=A0AA88DCV8_FICCA|nr:hypothetical protein TIFTF001_020658 [Ficus carica]
MANTDSSIRAFQVLGLLCLTLLVQKSCGTNFTIGGSKVFKYPADQDSVLLVSEDDYHNCNTDHPLQKFDDGNTVFPFSESGPHYFISGKKDNCVKNEKVIVIVLSERNQTISPSPTPTPTTPPSPAPSSQESPSPPNGTAEGIPAPAPVSEPPPPSGASSVYMSFLGCIGALVASSFVI